jgi:hypothetical protein
LRAGGVVDYDRRRTDLLKREEGGRERNKTDERNKEDEIEGG